MRPENWTFSSIMSLVLGATTAVFFWWFIMYEGAWPFMVFAPLPAIPSVLFSLYALKAHESAAAFVGLLLALSPLAIFLR